MRVLAATLLVALLSTAATAGTPAATVHVDADGALGPAGAFAATCSAEVGGTLGEALDDAVASGCLDSLDTTQYSFGRFVDCVNDVCNDFGTLPLGLDARFWIVYENGLSASFGIDDLQVDDGDVFHLSYDACAFAACVPNWVVP